MNKNAAPKVLKQVLKITPEAWLFGATLLGAIRNGKIIEWDKDIDLGIPSEIVDEKLLARFREAGFVVNGVYRFGMLEMRKYIPDAFDRRQFGKFILRKNGVKVEMCCFAKGTDGRLYYASGTPRFFVLAQNLVYPQKKLPMYDFEANVPVHAEQQLEFVYGKDWREPRQRWYFTADHYLRREHTIIELKKESDGTLWSKWRGREVIAREYGPQNFPEDINTPHNL